MISNAAQFNENYQNNPFFKAKVDQLLREKSMKKAKWYMEPSDAE